MDPETRFRLENERLRLLIDFLKTPVNAPQDEDGRPDDDLSGAYTWAITDTLKGIRMMARGMVLPAGPLVPTPEDGVEVAES